MNVISTPSSSPTISISPVDALWTLIQGQTKAVRKALAKRLFEEENLTKEYQEVMIKNSMTKAFDELHAGKAKHHARMLFEGYRKFAMNVIFDYLPEFETRAKALAKKYKSFQNDYATFLDELERNPFGGESLGHHTYKYRMAIASKGKGKSGGARVITYNVQSQPNDEIVITLMSIYDKNEISNVSDSYLRSLIQMIEGL